MSVSGGIALLGPSPRRPSSSTRPSPAPPGDDPGSGRPPAVRTSLLHPHAVGPRRTVAGLSLAILAPLLIGGLSGLASSPAATLPGFGCLLVVVVAALVGGILAGFAAAVSGFRPRFSPRAAGRRVRRRCRQPLRPATFGLAAVVVAHLLARDQAARGALEHSEERHRHLVEELPLVTYSARVDDSRAEYVSPQIERLLELTAEQALAEQDFWTPRLHALDRGRVLAEWHAWCADPGAEPFRRTYRMLTDGGRVIWVDDVTILVGDGADKHPRFQRHLLDVSEQRQLEEQLREAQKFEALGRLAGGVAHDFNNLLSVIAGYSERLVPGLPERTQLESAAAIGAAADRGTALVRQLLSFSRPQPSDHRLIDLNTLVAEFVPLLRRVIGEDVELELAFERHPLPVEVDPARIDQVLMNLVVNARDAMPCGGRLTIATAAVDVDEAAGDRLVRRRSAVVTVSDTGTGIDAATRERIFEPFFSTKERGKGSGLGLATAYGIVAQANGTIAVSSTPGRGTTFLVHLPLAASGLAPRPSRSPSRPPRRAGPRACSWSRTRPPCGSSSRSCSRMRATECIPPRMRRRRWSSPAGTRSTSSSRRRDARHERPATRRRAAGARLQPPDDLRVGLRQRRVLESRRPRRQGRGRAEAVPCGELLGTVREVLDSPSAGPSARTADPHSPRQPLRAVS